MSICINPDCSNPQNSDTQLFCKSCNSELLLQGRYRVTRQMGSGGFGKTYEVTDRQDTPKVLKVLTKNHPKYVELFLRESQILALLEHPGIPRVEPDTYFTFFPRNSKEPLHCLVMEMIYGLDLHQYLRKRGTPIDQKLAIQWLTQLVSILQEVHNHNFFHRDIKPSNIMLRADGPLVLIDFGTAREITGTFMVKQAAGQVTGVMSAGYTPPEQLNGQAVPQSDFFALGRTFVYLLTGKDPSNFYDPYTDELHWRNAVPVISLEFADFLDRLMARFPNQRPQTAEIILQQLAEINLTLPSTQLPSQPKFPGGSQQTETTAYLPQNPNSVGRQNTSGQSKPSTSPPSPSQLRQNFISKCQQELAELIGPMASIICKRTLQQNPGISQDEFVEALAKKIPDRQQAKEFEQRLLS